MSYPLPSVRVAKIRAGHPTMAMGQGPIYPGTAQP